MTVVAPVSQPSEGYVVYEDTRRASAGRRLDKTLNLLRQEQIRANGLVVETDPVMAVKDALAQLEPPVTEIIVSTHPRERSGWMRRNVVERVTNAAGSLPVEHVVAADAAEGAVANVLVVANQTLLNEKLLRRIRERLARPRQLPDRRAAEPRLHRPGGSRTAAPSRGLGASGGGLDAHGQIAHPDHTRLRCRPCTTSGVDEIIVSTFGGERSGWLRRDLVERLRNDARLPIEHVVNESTEATV